ncbi:hypothetical protein ACI7YT_12645 [Microbacterium sp. M]|uniref:hypothetical protein n=1 Tax=Microbacterium sp. M TaxID=3377125 RepID=UPI0038704489
MTTAAPPLMFILTASKRAVKRADRSSQWESDEEGFLKRWPDNRRPDTGIQRSADATQLIASAKRLNDAQINGDFLDWLYSVDIDFPVHTEKCTPSCPTWKDPA